MQRTPDTKDTQQCDRDGRRCYLDLKGRGQGTSIPFLPHLITGKNHHRHSQQNKDHTVESGCFKMCLAKKDGYEHEDQHHGQDAIGSMHGNGVEMVAQDLFGGKLIGLSQEGGVY